MIKITVKEILNIEENNATFIIPSSNLDISSDIKIAFEINLPIYNKSVPASFTIEGFLLSSMELKNDECKIDIKIDSPSGINKIFFNLFLDYFKRDQDLKKLNLQGNIENFKNSFNSIDSEIKNLEKEYITLLKEITNQNGFFINPEKITIN
jgi:hypothetical protein